MNIKEIEEIVSAQIQVVMDGHEAEHPKIDFKRDWYDLTDDVVINEFLKDSSAIANSPGLDGFIVIGFDPKTKNYHDTKFSDCKLKDENELSNLINRKVDRLYHVAHYAVIVNGYSLSILHIPPSFDKPHVIRNYKNKAGVEQQHRVFTRYGSTTRIATKYDLDFIAFDRVNHIPEYDLQICFSKLSYTVALNPHTHRAILKMTMTIENTGRRAVSIHEIVLRYDASERTPFTFTSWARSNQPINNLIKVSNIIVSPGEIELIHEFEFGSDAEFAESVIEPLQNLHGFSEIFAVIKTTSGVELKTRVQVIK